MLSGLMKTFRGVFRHRIAQWRNMLRIFVNLCWNSFIYFPREQECQDQEEGGRNSNRYGGYLWNASPTLRICFHFYTFSFSLLLFFFCTPPLSSFLSWWIGGLIGSYYSSYSSGGRNSNSLSDWIAWFSFFRWADKQ